MSPFPDYYWARMRERHALPTATHVVIMPKTAHPSDLLSSGYGWYMRSSSDKARLP